MRGLVGDAPRRGDLEEGADDGVLLLGLAPRDLLAGHRVAAEVERRETRAVPRGRIEDAPCGGRAEAWAGKG